MRLEIRVSVAEIPAERILSVKQYYNIPSAFVELIAATPRRSPTENGWFEFRVNADFNGVYKPPRFRVVGSLSNSHTHCARVSPHSTSVIIIYIITTILLYCATAARNERVSRKYGVARQPTAANANLIVLSFSAATSSSLRYVPSSSPGPRDRLLPLYSGFRPKL